jgi:hypothetical protein
MPFLDCVFLPAYWGFACASGIIRGRAIECPFYIPRLEYGLENLCSDKLNLRRLDFSLSAYLMTSSINFFYLPPLIS